MRTATRARRRDERGSGASRHPERVLCGKGAMESGEWLHHNKHRVCPSSPASFLHVPPRPLPCLPVLSSHCTTIIITTTTNSNNRPLFCTHRAYHMSHLSSGQPGVASLCPGRDRCNARPSLKIAQCSYFGAEQSSIGCGGRDL